MKFTTTCFLFLSSILSAVNGLPSPRPDIVFVPAIIHPEAKDVWVIGQTREVTWDISSAPAPSQITNVEGAIWLRHDNHTLNITLADNFNILLGRIEVVVPEVPEYDDYILVLFGDSGNFSPEFSITKGN